MRSRVPVFAVAAVLVAAATGGCSSPGYEKSASAAQTIRGAGGAFDQFRDSGETMLTSLATLLGVPRDDLPRKFGEFSRGVEAVRASEAALRSTLQGMRSEADARFRAWETELAQYQNADIRTKSEARLNEVRAMFEDAAAKADVALEPAAAFSLDAQDLSRFLSNDLTPGGLDAAADAAKKLRYSHGKIEGAAKPAKQALRNAADALSAAPAAGSTPPEEPAPESK